MRKLLITLVVCIALIIPSMAFADLYSRCWFATGRTGGGTGDLDGAISGVSINESDAAIVVDHDGIWVYKVRLDSASEDDPLVIAPEDVGGGATRWHLVDSGVSDLHAKKNVNAEGYIKGGVSTYVITTGTTLSADMVAGGMIYTFNTTPIVLGVNTVTSSTPYFMVKDVAGGGVTVQTADADPLYYGSETGTAFFVNIGNSRHQATFNCVKSGTCAFVDVIGTMGSGWDVE